MAVEISSKARIVKRLARWVEAEKGNGGGAVVGQCKFSVV